MTCPCKVIGIALPLVAVGIGFLAARPAAASVEPRSSSRGRPGAPPVRRHTSREDPAMGTTSRPTTERPTTEPAPGPAFSGLIPDSHGPAREAAILEAASSCLVPIEWVTLDASRAGVRATVRVSSDALRLRGELVHVASGRLGFAPQADGGSFWRISCSCESAQKLCDRLGASLPTSRIVDLAWEQCAVRLRAHPLGASADMTSTHQGLEHDQAVERDRGGRPGLVRPVGKDAILSAQYVPGYLVNYGWHDPGAVHRGPTGLRVWQPIPKALGGRLPHEASYQDYSERRTAVEACTVDGVEMTLPEALSTEKGVAVFSDEGPIRHTRIALP